MYQLTVTQEQEDHLKWSMFHGYFPDFTKNYDLWDFESHEDGSTTYTLHESVAFEINELLNDGSLLTCCGDQKLIDKVLKIVNQLV